MEQLFTKKPFLLMPFLKTFLQVILQPLGGTLTLCVSKPSVAAVVWMTSDTDETYI